MKLLRKILIVTAFLSFVGAFYAYAEEMKTPESATVVTESLTVVPSVPRVPAEKTTLDNLQTAFNGESNANARYLAFAQKAEEEGYGKVASLFRAAARAEQVHFERHAKVIKELGGVPVATIETPVVKTTAENLEAAMQGEIYESTVMYPEFLIQSEKGGFTEASDAFEDAQKAETVHAALYKEALANLKEWKGRTRNFYVCPFCGNVVERLNFKTCPICGENKKDFIAVK